MGKVTCPFCNSRNTFNIAYGYLKEKKVKKSREIPNSFIYHDIEEKMKSILGTKVSVNHRKNNRGKIEIEYYSPAELERIIELIETIRQY